MMEPEPELTHFSHGLLDKLSLQYDEWQVGTYYQCLWTRLTCTRNILITVTFWPTGRSRKHPILHIVYAMHPMALHVKNVYLYSMGDFNAHLTASLHR